MGREHMHRDSCLKECTIDPHLLVWFFRKKKETRDAVNAVRCDTSEILSLASECL